MRILVIAHSYPSLRKPYHGVFVKNLLIEMVKQGHEVIVISPQNILQKSGGSYSSIEDGISIFRPKFLSCGSYGVRSLNTYTLTQLFFNYAVLKTLKNEKLVADVVYSHFLLPSGLAAQKAGTILKCPVFCTLGENSLGIHETKMTFGKLASFIKDLQKFSLTPRIPASLHLDDMALVKKSSELCQTVLINHYFFVEINWKLASGSDSPLRIR